MFIGSIVAIVTPMKQDGSVDYAALDKLIAYHLSNGTDGIVTMGTTGESATLDVSEHTAVIEHTIKTVAGQIPVIAGTGGNATSEAVHLTRHAAKAGADGCLLVTPYYNKPTQEGLYQHYKTLAEAVDIPQVLYNVPGRTAVDMLPEITARLAKLNNVVAIKEACGDIQVQRTKDIVALCGDSIVVLSGEDDQTVACMQAGAQGTISVTANIAPKLMHDMCAAALAGDWHEAERINALLMPLHNNLFVESNPIPVKWALSRMGYMEPTMRLPLLPLSAENHAVVEAALQASEIIS